MEPVQPSAEYHPNNFEKFLPWACQQLGVEALPMIARIEQHPQHRGSATTNKTIDKTRLKPPETTDNDSKQSSLDDFPTKITLPVKIQAVYNNYNQLIQIKFNKKNTLIPRGLLRVVRLGIPYHKHVTAIYINSGLDQAGIVELNKIIAASNITEVTLDDTANASNHHILLDNYSKLKYLSLARCDIGDKVVKELALRLSDPLRASTTLTTLNLSSNGITDIGAAYLGDALRKNRQLAYLNLAGNRITDTGAGVILNTLIEYPLSPDELREIKLRHYNYLRHKNDLKSKHIQMLRESAVTTKSKKKTGKSNTATDQNDETAETMWLDLAEMHVKDLLGPFRDSYKLGNTVTSDQQTYCLGNNALCYLSLAYNNLSYISVKKLYNILSLQRNQNREPRGLINVSIEGNYIPKSCVELDEINKIIEAGMTWILSSSNNNKKKVVKKGNTTA